MGFLFYTMQILPLCFGDIWPNASLSPNDGDSPRFRYGMPPPPPKHYANSAAGFYYSFNKQLPCLTISAK